MIDWASKWRNQPENLKNNRPGIYRTYHFQSNPVQNWIKKIDPELMFLDKELTNPDQITGNSDQPREVRLK
jgi:hypothetical protein